MAAAVETARGGREGKSGKERLLDAAERLFAQHGFDGVSVRDITEAAQVDVALVSYHFGGKRELFASLFQRRAEHLNAERVLILEGALEAARPRTLSIEQLLDCYTQPMWRLAATGDPGWRYFFQIAAQVNNSPHWAPILMSRHFDAGAERLAGLMREALPGAPATEVYWAVLFLAGALTMTFAQTGRIDQLSGGACNSSDLETAMDRLGVFAAAGIQALAGTGAPAGLPSVAKRAKKATTRAKNPRKTANVRKKRP